MEKTKVKKVLSKERMVDLNYEKIRKTINEDIMDEE